MARLKQKTLIINGEKVLIKTKPLSRLGNLMGFATWINGYCKFFKVLTHHQARDKAFVAWVKRREDDETTKKETKK